MTLCFSSTRELGVGESAVLEVQTRPAEGNREAMLRLGSVEVPLSARAAVPRGCLLLSEEDHDFGVLESECPAREWTLTLRNICEEPIRLLGASLSNNSPAFSLTRALPEGGLEIPAGNGPLPTVTVAFAPSSFGRIQDSLLLDIETDGLILRYAVPVTGLGDVKGQTTLSFQNPQRTKLDLLFVVDNGLSMAPRRMELERHMRELFTVYPDVVDVHVGVTTSDSSVSGQNGRLLTTASGRPFVSRDSSPNFVAEAMGLVSALTYDSAAPSTPLHAAMNAVSEPLRGTANAGFLRGDARLAVVVITDRREGSPAPVASYVSSVNTASPLGVSFVLVSGLGGGASCGAEGDDGRFAELVAAGNEMPISLCATTWFGLPNCHRSPCTLRRTYYLDAVPGGEVRVQVDGTQVPQLAADGSVNWTFDTALNAITFAPGREPGWGQTLVIRFSQVCL